jgi:hypothetical protein
LAAVPRVRFYVCLIAGNITLRSGFGWRNVLSRASAPFVPRLHSCARRRGEPLAVLHSLEEYKKGMAAFQAAFPNLLLRSKKKDSPTGYWRSQCV